MTKTYYIDNYPLCGPHPIILLAERSQMIEGRRAILRRLLMVGGAAGAGIAGRRLLGESATTPAGGSWTETLELRGRQWHIGSQSLRAGMLPGIGDRMLAQGTLVNSQDGSEIGEFYAHVVGVVAPGHEGPKGVASLEQHTFNLPDGTITGSGIATRDIDRPDEFAIIGGTGRFAGATGSYTARQSHWEFGGDGTASFTLTIFNRAGEA